MSLTMNPQIRSVIMTRIEEIAAQQRKQIVPLTDDLPLLESGLDSLCIALLVASLDDALDIDPFVAGVSMPVTLGDLIRLYEHAAS
jgi:acyl carrier protein